MRGISGASFAGEGGSLRKSISRPIIICIMNLKRGRALLLPVSVQTSESLLGKERRGSESSSLCMETNEALGKEKHSEFGK